MRIETGVAECAIAAKVPDAAETGMSRHQGYSSDYGGSMACETHEGVSAAKKSDRCFSATAAASSPNVRPRSMRRDYCS